MTIETSISPGERCVFLRAGGPDRAVQLLAFVAPRPGALEVWQTPDERRVPPRRTGTFREPLEPLRIARLLASGEAGAHLHPGLAGEAVVEGVEEGWEPLLLGAWAHILASRDPALHALLSVEPALLDAWRSRTGAGGDLADHEELAAELAEANRAWLEQWRGEIEAEVRSRVTLYEEVKGAGEVLPTEDEIRSFVERCLLKLGRLPREDEDAIGWDGKDLAIAGLTQRRRAKLGLDVNDRIGRYRVRASYLSALEARGWDFDQGAGWYLMVLNPNINWMFNDPVGPYHTPEEAIGDASHLAEQE